MIPGAAWFELALAVAKDGALADAVLTAPLVLPDAGEVALQVTVLADGGVRIHSADDDAWTLHFSARVQPAEPPPPVHWPLPPTGCEEEDADDLYDRLAEYGLAYGPSFRTVRRLWREAGGDARWVDLALSPALTPDGHRLHPALLDGALHALALWVEARAAAPTCRSRWSG